MAVVELVDSRELASEGGHNTAVAAGQLVARRPLAGVAGTYRYAYLDSSYVYLTKFGPCVANA